MRGLRQEEGARRGRGAAGGMSLRTALGALLALAFACACGGERGPQWIDLARAEVRGNLPQGEVALPGGARARYELLEGELWLVTTIARAAWSARAPGRWTTFLSVIAVGHSRVASAPYRLLAGARSFTYEADPARFGATSGAFTTNVLALELVLAPGEEPPETCELAAVLDHVRVSEGTLRFAGRRQSGSGFWVPPGEPRRVALALPPESVLSFGLALEPLLGERAGRMAAHTFRVELDGALVFEHTLAPDVLGEAVSWHEVPLPGGGVKKAALTFSVDGPPALTSVVDPLVAPRERGRAGARPWRE
ncbi:MAG: hypothetical protein ABL998_21365, partial [Planctomycetota bacterium]